MFLYVLAVACCLYCCFVARLMLPRLLFSCVVLCVCFGGVRPRCGLEDVFGVVLYCVALRCVLCCVVACCGISWYIVVLVVCRGI